MINRDSEASDKELLARDLIPLLSVPQPDLRMLGLHLLCEGYVYDDRIPHAVFQGWDQWGPEAAFSEFPMLSFLHVAEHGLPESCTRAGQMVAGHKLTDPASRCAGKLIEQAVTLPAKVLQEHVERIVAVTRTSKIFFRVDLEQMQRRIAFSQEPADALAVQLEHAVAQLTSDPANDAAMQLGVDALEAIRRYHPGYLDLSSVLGQGMGASSSSHQAASFRLTLHSLMQLEQPGLEPDLEQHLVSDNDFVCVNVVEALVRAGNRAAAEAFVNQFDKATPENQKWIARGLQRIRVDRLAPAIAALRDGTRDPHLWLMLLIAEVRQCDPESAERLAYDLPRLRSPSETLADSLRIYLRVHDKANMKACIDVVTDYLDRTGTRVRSKPDQEA